MNPKNMIAAIALLASAAAGAQTIYRCGNSYSAEPCPGAKMVEAARDPSAAEVAEARDEVHRESQLADEMHAARLKEEALHKPQAQRKTVARERARPAKMVVIRAPAAAKEKKPAAKKAA